MNTAVQHYTTVTTAGGIQKCGRQVSAYCLRTDGANDATLKIHEGGPAGPVVWQDTCIGADKAKPFSPRRPIGPSPTGDSVQFVEVTGTGAECDVLWE